MAKERRWGPQAQSADYMVGRPGVGPTDLPLWATFSPLGPLIIGTGMGFCIACILLWWAIFPSF